jgi:hypothetical protein
MLTVQNFSCTPSNRRLGVLLICKDYDYFDIGRSAFNHSLKPWGR